ncbi:MAG: hypothetical protein A07HR60_00100, partial [uncultured archaeon A07HR60]
PLSLYRSHDALNINTYCCYDSYILSGIDLPAESTHDPPSGDALIDASSLHSDRFPSSRPANTNK